MMEQNITKPDCFNTLSHGAMGYCDANNLDDFSFTNQRGERSKTAFQDLCSSVTKHKGVHTAVGVRFNPKVPNRLELIFGHGRRDAAIETNINLIPFKFFAIDDATAFELHLSENLDRSDLDTVAKAKAAQSYLAHFKADYEAVASKLNMSVKKLRSLLELNRCSDLVLQAVRDKKISEGHALLLAPFHKVKQDKNLSLIIGEGWSINVLRERTGKVKLPLSRAIFDTKACDSCEFNSAHQIGLFEIGDGKAECAESSCYKTKTSTHLEIVKQELNEKYGQVLLLSECNKDDRNAVNSDKLGNEQWATCRSCDDKVAVLNDDIYKNLGAILKDQCINRVCFSKCKTAYDDEVKKVLKSEISDSEIATETQLNNAKKIAKNTTVAKAKGVLPNKAIENYK
jgi:PRTRC genetic system ParB family protein